MTPEVSWCGIKTHLTLRLREWSMWGVFRRADWLVSWAVFEGGKGWIGVTDGEAGGTTGPRDLEPTSSH